MKTKTNRREFLKQSVAFSTSLFLGSAYSRVLGANDDIRVAIVGTGWKGGEHIDGFKKLPGVRVTAICDVDRNILAEQAQKFKDANEKVAQYTDVRKLLDDKDIDAIIVATPNHWHSLIGIWACQAGKDVYVEKPISHNIWEGGKLVEAARKYNRIVQAGTQNRSDIGFREAVAYIREGNLGKIRWAHGLWYRQRESIGKVEGAQIVTEHIDYDLWTGPAALKPLMRKRLHYDWHWIWETGNGEMGNLGTHQVDDCLFALGLDALPGRALSFGNRFLWNDDGQTPNTQLGVFDYADIPIIVELRNLPRTPGIRAMDHFREIRMGNIIQCEHGYCAGGRGGGWIYGNDGKKIKAFPGDGGATHQANFIEAVRNRDRTILKAEIEQGHRSVTLCHIANTSYRIGHEMSVEEVKALLEEMPLATKTLERIVSHLAKNQISLQSTPLICGPWVTFDERKGGYAGNNSQAANKHVRREIYRAPFVVPEQV